MPDSYAESPETLVIGPRGYSQPMDSEVGGQDRKEECNNQALLYNAYDDCRSMFTPFI